MSRPWLLADHVFSNESLDSALSLVLVTALPGPQPFPITWSTCTAGTTESAWPAQCLLAAIEQFQHRRQRFNPSEGLWPQFNLEMRNASASSSGKPVSGSAPSTGGSPRTTTLTAALRPSVAGFRPTAAHAASTWTLRLPSLPSQITSSARDPGSHDGACCEWRAALKQTPWRSILQRSHVLVNRGTFIRSEHRHRLHCGAVETRHAHCGCAQRWDAMTVKPDGLAAN